MADSSLIGSAAIDINKIKSKLGEISQQNIKLSINSQDILGKIGNVKSELDALTKSPYEITVNLAGTAETQIQNLQNQLDNINKQSAKQARSQQRTNRKSGGSSKKLEQSTGFPVSRRKWAEKYRDEAQKEVDKYIESLRGNGATLLSSSVKAKYNKTGKIIGYDGVVAYRDEVGKTVQAVLSLQDAQNKVWKVNSTTVNTSYEAQAKYLDEIQKKYASMEESAFSSKNALDANSPFGVAATDALKNYKAELDKVVNRKDYSNDSRANLERIRQETEATIEQQKALRDAQQYRDTYYTKQKAEYDKRFSEAFVQGINGTPLKDQFKDNAESYFKTWNDELTKIQNQTTKVTAEQENKILELRTKAMLAAKEQQHLQSGGSTLVGPDISSKVSTGFTDITLLEEKLKQTGQYTNEAKTALDGFRESLARTENVDQFNAWNDSFKVLKGQIAEVQAQTKTGVLADNFKLDTAAIQKQADELKQKYQDVISKSPDKADTNIDTAFTKLQASINNINPQNISTVRKEFQALQETVNNIKIDKDITGDLLHYGSELDAQISRLQGANRYTGDIQAAFDGLKESLGRVTDAEGLEQWKNAFAIIKDEVKAAQAELDKGLKLEGFSTDLKNVNTQFDNLVKKYREIVAANPSKADAGIEGTISRLQDMFDNMDLSKVDPKILANIRKELTGLGREINGLQPQSLSQILTQNLGGVGQYLARFTSAFYIINKGIQTVKSMVNEVKSLDTSLVELQKVTNLSGESLTQFTDSAYKTGKEVGRTGKDVIDAVTTFSRAGYNLEESNQLAKAALTMTNVGVDIPNTEAAASDMISILKAFDKQANESMEVIDKLYNVANKEPLDFGNITQMLVTAGGTLAQTNTSLEETMGLLTGGFATLRDESVANGLIMISQRLRGVKEDGEAIEEEGFMPKLKKAFGDVGIAIEDQNGELRSTYDILNDLAGVWDQLSSKQRQYLGEKAAGNRQVKTLNAIMGNWDVVQDTIQKANEATGEATKGNEKYLDSIEGRITQFKSAFSDLARTTIDSDFVKGIVGIGTTITEASTSIGGLIPIITTLLGLLTAIKSLKIQKSWDAFSKSLSKSFSGQGIGGGIGKLGLFVAGLTILSTALSGLEKKLDQFNVLESSKKSYQSAVQDLESTETNLNNVRQQIVNIKSLGSLSLVQQQELADLERMSAQLETQYEIQKNLVEVQKQLSQENFAKLFENYSSYSTGYSGFDFLNFIKQLSAGWVSGDSPFAFIGEGLEQFGVKVEDWGKSNKEIFDEAIDNFKVAQTEITNRNVETFGALRQNEMEVFGAAPIVNQNVEDNRKARSKAFDDLNKALLIYKQYQAAAQDIERNDTTEPYFKMLDQMGEAITNAMQYATDLDNALITPFQEVLSSERFSSVSQQLIDLAKEGKLTIDTLSNVDGIKNFTDTIGTLGITAQDAVKHLNDLYAPKQMTEDEGFENIIASLGELTADNYLASKSYKTLSAAMTEQQKSGKISIDTYQKLIDTDKKLADALTLTADGYELNTEAATEYIKTKTEENKLQALMAYQEQAEKLEELKKKREELNNVIGRTAEIREDIASNDTAIRSTEQEMEALAAYIRELDNATSALTRFQAAQSSANSDANYQVSKKVYDVIKEGNKTGKIGTDEYTSAVDYVLGDNWKEQLNQFGGSVEKARKEAEKKSKRYSGQKDERTGLTNFMKDVAKTGLGTYSAANGLVLNDNVSLDELSEKMKISKEYLVDLFKALNTYSEEGEGFTFPEMFSEDDLRMAESQRKEIEALGDTEQNVKGKIEDIDKQISESEGDTSQLEKRRSELEQSLKAIQDYKSELEGGEELNVDTMTLDEAKQKIDELYQVINTLNGEGIKVPVEIGELYDTLLNTFPQLRDDLNQPIPPIAVKVEDNASEDLKAVTTAAESVPPETNTQVEEQGAKETNKELSGVANAAVSIPDTAKVNVEEQGAKDTKTKLSDVNSTAEGVKDEVGITVTDNGTADATKKEIQGVADGPYNADVNTKAEGTDEAKSNINNVAKGPYDANVNTIAKGTSEAGDAISTVANDPYNAYIDVDHRNLEQTDGAIDKVANKDRTATIQVKYNVGGIDVEPDQLDEYGMLDPTKLTPEQTKQWQDKNGTSSIVPFGGISSEEAEENGITAKITADEQSGKNIVKQVQDQVDAEPPVEEKIENNSDGIFPGDEGYDELGVNVKAVNPEEPIQQVQDIANATPIETTFNVRDSVNTGAAMNSLIDKANKAGVNNTDGGKTAIADLQKAYVELSKAREKAENLDIGDESGAAQAASDLQSAASSFVEAYNNLSSMTNDLSVEPIEVDANTDAALKKVQAIADNGVTISVKANTSSAENSIDALSNKTVTITVQANPTGFAKGTRNADPGLSLVDEKGAELIEHTRQGTFELGTNNGPRFTNLEKGDVVHTASETKRIMSRLSKIGGFFRDGLNQAKSVLTGGAFAGPSTVVGSGGKMASSTKKKSSFKKSSKKSSKGSSTKTSNKAMKKLQTWFEKLFDWAEVRLDRLERITNDWVNKAAEAVGYAAKNTQLNSAIKSVQTQIKDTTAAYNLYMQETDIIAKKMKLSEDIVNKIKNGTIQIASYDKKTQQKIQYVQEYYEKALNAKDALQELRQQEKELATQKLDNIVTHFDARTNYYESQIKRRNGDLELAEAQGREQRASDYNTSIDLTNKKLNNLVQERAALNTEFSRLVSQGYIKKDSEEWYEYQSKITDLDSEILTVKKDIIDLHDAANQVNLTKLTYQLDALTNSASHLDEMMNLHSAQAIKENAESYKSLIDNGMEQIKNLQAQNAEYRKQQQGLDKMSAKYQELEASIQSNISAINQMKISQEGWNDAVYDVEIDKINDFKDQLEKTNDLYERQKNLQDAIQELEKARTQRTQRVFRMNEGFVYEADQEAVREAQESLEDVVRDELMNKMDDLIDALEESKDNSNIYDANGNLLGTQYVIPQLDNLSSILSNYYKNPNTSPSVDAIRKLFMDELVSSNNTSNSNQVNMSIGDIIVNEANDGNDLANAIVNQLPNAILQALYKK